MFNPIRAIRDAGAWTADKFGELAAKTPMLKSMTPKQKSFAAGVAGTVLGAGILFAGAEIAMGSLLIGGFLHMFGILGSLGPQLLGIGAAASAGAVFGAGMVAGADNHCGFLTRALDASDRVADRIENFFTRTRAPKMAHQPHVAPPAPGEVFAVPGKPVEAFAAVAAAKQQADEKFSLRRVVQKQLKP